MQVRKLDTQRGQDVRQFINFPFKLYHNCPQWVPPIVSDMELVLNCRKYPFYRHSVADFFVAESNGKTLGRIAVLDHRSYNDYHHRRTAFFYFFDAVEDIKVARALFNAAFDWARSRGLNEMIGPRGFMEGDGLGLLVEGFEHRPAMGIPYNYAYYDAFVRDSGFEKDTDFLSGYLRGDYELPQRFFDIAEKIKERRGLRIKSFTSMKELRQWIPRIGRVANDAFVDNYEYFPLSDEELQVVAERLAQVSDPRLIKLVMKGDEIIGFAFAFPDLSAAIQRIKGRLWPFGWIHLLLEFKRTKWVNGNGLGLLPGHQGVGGDAILFTELAKSIKEFHFEHADIVQVEEKNAKSLGDMTAIGVEWYKRHRIYRRSLWNVEPMGSYP